MGVKVAVGVFVGIKVRVGVEVWVATIKLGAGDKVKVGVSVFNEGTIVEV